MSDALFEANYDPADEPALERWSKLAISGLTLSLLAPLAALAATIGTLALILPLALASCIVSITAITRCRKHRLFGLGFAVTGALIGVSITVLAGCILFMSMLLPAGG